MELTQELLEQRGYVPQNQDNVVLNYVKKINELNDVVIAISPLEELFIWVKDPEFEDPNMDGIKIHVNTDDLEQIEKLAEIIDFVEF